MASAVIMPRQGQSVESCLIGKWYKQKGDTVFVGDLLFTYETDKAVFEEEAQVEGVLLDVFFDEGDDVPCLLNVCAIGALGESAEEFRPVLGSVVTQRESPRGGEGSVVSCGAASGMYVARERDLFQAENTSRLPRQAFTIENGVLDGGSFPVSPRAMHLAERTYADLRYASPSGAGGRIIERDVQDVLSRGYRVGADVDGSDSAPADVKLVPLSHVRKIIAKSMQASLADSAQLTNHSSFDASDIFAFRKKLKSLPEAKRQTNITVTDIIIYAVSRVLLEHKNINSHFLGDKTAIFSNAHIGVAVDTPRGLLVPTVFNANSMSLTELSAHTKDLFDKCKQGSASPDLLKGASFTISNLGGLGVEMFTPILNPPQCGILGVCCVIERTKDGKPYPAMGLSLTYDHRAVDGADAARFSMALAEYLENFSSNLDK
ncbi:MAG: 2-oxo acid dehydrogenase subunit E2 [Oscillospiraceae bacterium]|jgi:pyruvate dehydrogenase E2 component (dihydrolipoamide acetyltransferase)|nr:2-oxo acid dehydrogenase subunit E2 [Oscillospiraceae bacterium]